MAADDEGRDESGAGAARAADMWDRVGQYLQGSGLVGQRIADRNLRLWNQVSAHLRSGRYTSDMFLGDAASAVDLAMVSAADVWSGLTRPPERERVAVPMPSAFLFFDRLDARTHVLVDPTLVRVPVSDERPLPHEAAIVLSGGPPVRQASEEVDPAKKRLDPAEKLRSYLVALLAGPGVYRIDVISREPVVELVPGAYDGLVYITDPPYALANLRVVVEGPPPEVGDRPSS
jgi:hypothetical protein